jgi:hypothetical protein
MMIPALQCLALEGLRLPHGLLQRVGPAGQPETLDRRHRLAGHGLHRNLARPHRLAPDHHRARPAPPLAASEFRVV